MRKTIGDEIDHEEYSEEYINAVNKTYSIMCSRKQVMPRIVADFTPSINEVILDFGAGKNAFGAAYLIEKGYKHVHAYEIGDNYVEGLHDHPGDVLTSQYMTIFANNVLNVQPGILEVIDLLMTIQGLLARGGKFICNYPLNPRKCDMSVDYLEGLLTLAFSRVERLKTPGYRTPMWMCTYD